MSSNKTTFHAKPAHFEKKDQICPNSLIFHRNMSDSAIRFILALNGIWTSCRTWIPVQSDLEKRLNWTSKKMRRIIKECVHFGYLKVRQNRSKNGQFTPNEFEFDIDGKYNQIPSHNEYEPMDENGVRLKNENPHYEECPHNEYEPITQKPPAVKDQLPCSSKTFNLVLLANQETNKQKDEDLFVCSLDENQKKILDLLKPYDFPDKEIERMFGIPAQQIQNALLAYDQYRKGKTIDNPIGCIKKAILSCWMPNKTKLNEAEERERIEKETRMTIEENESFTNRIIEKNQHNFNENFSVSFSGYAVNLKSKTGVYPLNILDADFKSVLEWFIDSNKKE